jgi:hypothetical protein
VKRLGSKWQNLCFDFQFLQQKLIDICTEISPQFLRIKKVISKHKRTKKQLNNSQVSRLTGNTNW